MVDFSKNFSGDLGIKGSGSHKFSIFLICIFISALFIPTTVSGQNSPQITPVIDGIITHDEYEHNVHFDNDNYMIFWTINGSIISIGLKAKTSGWVAFGIEPTSRMKNADMIFGWVESNGNVTVLDCYATGPTGPHPPDTELGGTSDITVFAGTESGGWTSIEFNRSLSTGDNYDKSISASGRVKILWAHGSSDEFTLKHSERGAGTIDFGTGDSTEVEFELWYIHASWMAIAFILLASGMGIVLLMRRKSWWLKVHKNLGITGAGFAVIGLLSGIYMVAVTTGEHFSVPHTYLGLITIILVLIAPLSGRMILKNPEKVNVFKRNHRWLGRAALTMMVITMLAGFSLI